MTTTHATRFAAGADHLTKTYGTGDTAVCALDEVTIGIPAGEFTAVMGPSGSGKSTLMHMLAGLDRPTSGRIVLGDKQIDGLSDRALTKVRREHVGFVFQGFNLLPMLSARENILLPLDLAGRKVETQWFDAVVEVLGLRDRLRHKPTELSGGQQQRVAVARALISRPDVIFADEPTGALDQRTGHELLGFLRRSVREWGQTVVMVTHDPMAASYADQVVLLADGRFRGTLREPTTDSVVDAVRGLGER